MLCGKGFQDEEKLTDHEKYSHEMTQLFRESSLKFQSKHIQQAQFQPQQCQATCAIFHFKSEKCDQCDATTITENALKEHIHCTHNPSFEQVPLLPVPPLPVFSLKCGLCNFTTDTKNTLYDHNNSLHADISTHSKYNP